MLKIQRGLKLLLIFTPFFCSLGWAQADVLRAAEQLFSSSIGEIQSIAFEYSSTDCLRTGYQFEKKRIVFCSNNKVIEGGVLSKDVIAHEAAHAMICQLRTDWCETTVLSNSESVAIHEALADFFASLLDDNQFFGENFYRDLPWIRRYENSLCYALSSNSYLRAGALNRHWNVLGLQLNNFKKYILEGRPTMASLKLYLPHRSLCFEENARIYPVEGEPSSLNRYRIPLTGAAFRIAISEELYRQISVGDISIVDNGDHRSADFTIEVDGLQFYIRPVHSKVRGRYFIKIQNSGQQTIGLMPLYLSVRKEHER